MGVGIAICEDFWHLTVPQLLALDGAQILINVSSSPGRDLAANLSLHGFGMALHRAQVTLGDHPSHVLFGSRF